MKKVIVIPARFESTRLPGKPLIDILGKTVLQRTFEQCLKAFPANEIFVATDSDKIKSHCDKLGMNVIMTSERCLTGTDRVAELAEKVDADYYINVQGDEPIINPFDIKTIADSIYDNEGKILNGYAPIENETDYYSRSIPKVVFRPDGRLLYMSRAPIPGTKEDSFLKAWRQICIYAFPRKALESFVSAKHKTVLEGIEDIEILRFIELGFDVKMIELIGDSLAVDVPEDVEKVKQKILANE